jgi:hypothetical protein
MTMTPFRPPLGGLFRVSAPKSAATCAAAREAGPDAQAEAREAIRSFISVLEKLDREVAGKPVRRRAVKSTGGSAPEARPHEARPHEARP